MQPKLSQIQLFKIFRIVFPIFFIALLCSLTSCGNGEYETNGRTYEVYYVNNEETRVVSSEYRTVTEDGEELLDELIAQLGTMPSRMEYKAPLAENFQLLEYTRDGEQLTLNFDRDYKEMGSIKEVLIRAAIVRTLSQVENVRYISFTVQGEPLMDNGGVAVGTMSADMFIDNAGDEINTYEKVNLHLYFANENGDRLVEENQRNVEYNSNISVEKLVVEKLIEGPLSDGAYPTINPETKVISVTVNDRICYVNLDEAFLTQPYNVTSDVTIYSITNSLVELPNINKVQISINGETALLYKESLSLTTIFERNLDLIGTEELKTE
ncbi:MAG: GerMN domain-containing protein [Lachnospiraceae bacterium]|nr:GerMN domain-containing protein [Lachnospiraceae bacterium]